MKKILLFIFILTSIGVNAQDYPVQEIKIADELVGDLYKGKNKKTVILIIPGSGPTDRNGNSVGIAENNSLKFLAQSLWENKYNVFTYDKRAAYALKYKNEAATISFQQGIEDAKTVIQYLKDSLHFHNVVVIGHSEGSLVGMIAARNTAAAFISIAGAGNTIDIIIKEQLSKQAPDLSDDITAILHSLKKGEKVAITNPLFSNFFSAKNQTYLIDWIKFDPVQEINKLHIPILIINGTKDIQASITEAEILHKAYPTSELVVIKDMNHIFKVIKNDADNQKSYFNPNLPIAKELTSAIIHFLKKNKR